MRRLSPAPGAPSREARWRLYSVEPSRPGSGAMPSPACAAASAADAPAASACSTPLARTAVAAAPQSATRQPPEPFETAAADDRPVLRSPVELGVRALRLAARDADLRDQLALVRAPWCSSRRRTRRPRSCACRRRPGRRSPRPGRARPPAGRREDRPVPASRRSCRGCAPAGRRSRRPPPTAPAAFAATSALSATTRWRVHAPITSVPPSMRMPESSGNARDVDERLGRREPQLERRHERMPAGQRQRASAHVLERLRDGAGALVGECLGDHQLPAFACWMASHTRPGWSGISRCRMPSPESASTAALTTHALAAIVPASPMPLTPSGLRGRRRDRARRVDARQLGRRGDHVVDERAREDLPALVVDRLLVERLRDRLHDAAVHLALDDHRVDHVAAVVDRRVALDRDLARLAVDLDLGDVRAEREREVGRVVERRRLEVRLDARGHRVPGPGGEGQLLDRLGALGRALDLPLARRPLEVVGRALEQVRGDQARLVAHLLARQLQRRAADRQRARAVGAEAVGRLARVAVRRPRPGRTGCRARSRRSATSTSRGPGRAPRSP